MAALKKLGILAVLVVVTVVFVYATILFWDALGFRSPVFAFMVNWFAFCWAGMVVSVVKPAAYLILPERYYAVKDFEQTGQVYERLGIRLIKRLVYRGPFRVFSPTMRLSKFSEGLNVSALRRLEHETRKGEATHLFVFVLVLPFVGYAALRGWLDAVLWLMTFNVILNVYPVMLQRYHRNRLQKLLKKLTDRHNKKIRDPEHL